MKIGILTFHRAHNYGAVLQCFALQVFLRNQGYKAKVVDYNNRDLWRCYDWYNPDEFRYAISSPRKAVKRCFKLLVKWYKRIPRFYSFTRFQNHQLDLCPVSEIVKRPFDLILIGSDQVWNTSITHGFDPYYWGQFNRPPHTRVATYAASLRGRWEDRHQPTVRKYLQSLNAVSVREMSLLNTVIELFPKINPVVVPDPVLLFSAQEWERFAIKPRISVPYVFFYQAMDSERTYEMSEEIARRMGKRLIVLSANVNGRNSSICRGASPFEFIGWIKNADLVVTSSYHATAFSIVFQKEFYCIDLNLGEDNRLKDLLSTLGLENRFIGSIDDINSSVTKLYDCRDVLGGLQNKAKQFISSAICIL